MDAKQGAAKNEFLQGQRGEKGRQEWQQEERGGRVYKYATTREINRRSVTSGRVIAARRPAGNECRSEMKWEEGGKERGKDVALI